MLTTQANRDDEQIRRIHASLLTIRNLSRHLLLEEALPKHLHKSLVNIENLADLAESLLSTDDKDVSRLLDAKLNEHII